MNHLISRASEADLRTLLKAPPIVMAPGVYDALSALLAQRAGFRAAFVSGSAIASTQLGRPDIGLLSVAELANVVEHIRERVSIPLLVDADSGYGNAINVMRTVRLLERAGAAAIQIEDQIATKQPRALTSRPLVPAAEMVGKIKAAQDAKLCDRTIISARTDAAVTAGIDEALRRLEAYIGAGADMVFVEGLGRGCEMKRVVSTVAGRVPILYNCLRVENEPITAAQLETIGYAMVVFPAAAVLAATLAIESSFKELQTSGVLSPASSNGSAPQKLSEILGTSDFLLQAKTYDANPH